MPMRNRVLFVYISTFDLHKIIKKSLIENGFDVTAKYIYKYNILYSVLLRISNKLLEKYLNYKYKQFLQIISINNYDTFFFVQPYHLKQEFLQKLRSLYPNAKFILYNWDSLVFSDYRSLITLFDNVFSYDIDDCINNKKIKYLPLFFSDFQYEIISKKIDISFVGSYKSQRSELIKSIKKIAKANNLTTYFYVYLNFATWLKILTTGVFVRNIHFLPLKNSKMQSIYNTSTAVIDMPGWSNGLTMRTFESLGSNAKLITTNQTVINHDFYHPNNVYIIKNSKIIDSKEILLFLKSPFIKSNNINKYHINSWICSIFNHPNKHVLF